MPPELFLKNHISHLRMQRYALFLFVQTFLNIFFTFFEFMWKTGVIPIYILYNSTLAASAFFGQNLIYRDFSLYLHKRKGYED